MYLQVFGGLAALFIAGDYLIRGTVSLSRHFGVSAMMVGLTVVAFGTSMPEMVVSVDAALTGAPGIALGNVIGSNIANVLLVLGVASFFCPTRCDAPHLRRNTAFVIAASGLLICMCWSGELSRWEGVILVCLLLAFLTYASRADSGGALDEPDVEQYLQASMTMTRAILVTGSALIGLLAGAHFLVEGAVQMARYAGISEAVIGLTLVAVGTSLPEVAAAVSAALRGRCDVAVGTVLGSCLFNILAIMGVTASIIAVPVAGRFIQFDLWIMFAAALVLAPFIFSRASIRWYAGVALLIAYGLYVAALFNGWASSIIEMV